MVNGYALMGKAHATALQAKNKVSNKVKSDWNDFKAGELSAQGLIEYVLIIAVISLVVIFAGPAVAKAIKQQFDKIVKVMEKGTGSGFGDGTQVGA